MSQPSPYDLSWLTARPIAHRGLHDLNQKCWENSLPAFERAVAGNFAIECDVVLTADKVPVVFHDHDLKRLTGHGGKVCEMTADEICQLTVGGTADRVPRLDEMLSLVGGRVPIVIELKGNAGHDDGFVEAVHEVLEGYNSKVAIMSFAHHVIRGFAKGAPGLPAGLTAEHTDLEAMEDHFAMLAHGISFVSFDVRDIPNKFVSFVRDELNLPFITWTVRDREAAERTWREGGQITFEGFDPDCIS